MSGTGNTRKVGDYIERFQKAVYVAIGLCEAEQFKALPVDGVEIPLGLITQDEPSQGSGLAKKFGACALYNLPRCQAADA